jgi:hypothetical protein
MPAHEAFCLLMVFRHAQRKLIRGMTPYAAVAATQLQVTQARHIRTADFREIRWAQNRPVIARDTADAEQLATHPDRVQTIDHGDGAACSLAPAPLTTPLTNTCVASRRWD